MVLRTARHKKIPWERQVHYLRSAQTIDWTPLKSYDNKLHVYEEIVGFREPPSAESLRIHPESRVYQGRVLRGVKMIPWSDLCRGLQEHVVFNSTLVGVYSGKKLKM